MRNNKKYYAILLLLSMSLIVMSVASLFIGRYALSVNQVINTLIYSHGGASLNSAATVIFNLRLPRIVAVILVGAGLSVAGATYQAVLKNSLASPDVLGTSSASAFGAALGILLGLPFHLASTSAFLFGILSLFMVFALCYLKKNHEPITTILAGIIVASLFVSFVSIIKYIADPQDTLPAIVFWLMGSFASLVKTQIYGLIPLYLICYLIIYRMRWKMNVLSLGDDEARVQGINPWQLKMILLIASSVLISASVTIAGVVGWVGLVIPHLVRSLVGYNHGKLIPVAAVAGALFLLIIDNLARALTYAEIPIGILTALIGAPLFAILYIRGDRDD
ncbi:TPA: iron ABC transporter permease [Klebsiella aerogenes]|uniref:FecCD family ABC transporter permease n=1 Tax=Klebsiella aerogenes TaxID=548 RepID=UPI002769E557|nr:iron ABC transporter permease [Klebsiella aerogenes]HDS6532695.1 iron ABC transporter permease [Klebsiella aerogenes]HDS7500336.1 iron ABC transporter permease [Klebsiella aerogenes]HDS9642375.1 iron ABC transporter permease [Klebsiella aerogenes]HDT0787875.1 iron ABC transporter permease [Klebsiella aerogenes]